MPATKFPRPDFVEIRADPNNGRVREQTVNLPEMQLPSVQPKAPDVGKHELYRNLCRFNVAACRKK